MPMKRNLIPAVVLVLAVFLPFLAGTAGASVFNTDGALHDALTGNWILPSSYYCIATPNGWTPSAALTPAVRRDDLAAPGTAPSNPACTISDTNTKNAVKYSDYPTNTVLRTRTDCLTNGYNWSYQGYCVAYLWTTDSLDSRTTASYYQDHNGCLRCHNATYMVAPTHNPSAAKESYLTGGHKNMSRPADGIRWGMPGVDATHPASPWLSGADLDINGVLTDLWIQEDYPRMAVDWTTAYSSAVPSRVTVGYCAKDGTGAIGSDDVPALGACPTCESPVMGNGNAGYPLNYPDAATCAAAATATGKPYTWISSGYQPLYWIYGGAGLEGGPAMMETGSQTYKCGRCHTTGWTANHTTDDIGTKHPQSDFPVAAGGPDFKTTTGIGTATLLLRPNTAGDSGTDVSSWDQWGIECSRCHVATDGGHATWPVSGASGTTPGGDVIALCMNCHRTESDTTPRANANANGYTANTNAAAVFTNKQQQPDGFAHHPDGPEFLNSPHAMFKGSWGQIGCPPYAINGYGDDSTRPYAPGAPTSCSTGTMNLDGSTPSLYASRFAQAAKADLGVSDTSAGSCVTCHDVHKPHNENTAGMSTGSTVACTSCHSNPADTVSPQIDLSYMDHPKTPGTPLANAATDPSSACQICHQPPGIKHLWRISTDPNYSTYGDYTYAYPVNGSSAAAAAKNVNMSPMVTDGTYTWAVWIDIDNACGQCHGGGVSQTDLVTTGSITAGSTDGTTINPLTVANATGFASGKEVKIVGAGWVGADFKTVIAKVVRTSPTSTTDLSGTVYLTFPAVTSVTSVTVIVAGNPTANGAPYLTKAALAVYAKTIHRLNSFSTSTAAPVVSSTTPTITGWQVQFTDSSTDADTASTDTVTVSWGDGTVDTGAIGATFSHTYPGTRIRSYYIRHFVTDSVTSAVSREAIKVNVPQRYTLSGTVIDSGSNALNGAVVSLRKNGHTVKYAKTGSGNTFTFTGVLPGAYVVHAYKFGATIPDVDLGTVSADNASIVVRSTTP